MQEGDQLWRDPNAFDLHSKKEESLEPLLEENGSQNPAKLYRNLLFEAEFKGEN